eukprot:CAMPEP_0119407530 /NCGR_PEP_ID=MMETSP1335-20130426/1385_1 /TAXON_ID=259385 /ORGANISM="Chrysoculter rhomboideus, Strain RCC1486" /LENGTH=53 /DNA_ID=CAMNT_0007431649 /DNA_START=244 /DNA_END=401 /DNA_ORIENTATION=+
MAGARARDVSPPREHDALERLARAARGARLKWCQKGAKTCFFARARAQRGEEG